MCTHIIFDLDGTLVYSHRGILNSIKYALNCMGLSVPADETLMKFIGPPLEYSYINFCNLNEKQCQKAVKLFRERYAQKGICECELIPRTFEMLGNLKVRGYSLHIATSKPREYTLEILRSLNIRQFFSCVGAAPLTEKTRDKTSIINSVKKSANIKTQDTVIMIGDRKEDVIGARNTGIEFIGVKYGYSENNEFEELGVENVFASVIELEQHLIAI